MCRTFLTHFEIFRRRRNLFLRFRLQVFRRRVGIFSHFFICFFSSKFMSVFLQVRFLPVVQKWHHCLYMYALTSSNINRFSKWFHSQNQEKICNNTVTKDPTTLQVCRYTTLWNVKYLKSNNWKQDDLCNVSMASDDVSGDVISVVAASEAVSRACAQRVHNFRCGGPRFAVVNSVCVCVCWWTTVGRGLLSIKTTCWCRCPRYTNAQTLIVNRPSNVSRGKPPPAPELVNLATKNDGRSTTLSLVLAWCFDAQYFRHPSWLRLAKWSSWMIKRCADELYKSNAPCGMCDVTDMLHASSSS